MAAVTLCSAIGGSVNTHFWVATLCSIIDGNVMQFCVVTPCSLACGIVSTVESWFSHSQLFKFPFHLSQSTVVKVISRESIKFSLMKKI